MKPFLVLLFLLATSALLRATWTLVESSTQEAPAGLEFTALQVAEGNQRAAVWTVTFHPRAHTFAVMDNPEGAFDLGRAAEKRGAVAAVNGGYFHPDRTPLGLVIRQGVKIHPLERAKLLSGIISVTPKSIAIQRTAAFKESGTIREALQAGPFLVAQGQPMTGLDQTRSAARTVVFSDAAGRCGILVCKNVTLSAMASILATPSIFPTGNIARALNLDGGSSTALWVGSNPPFYLREWKGVRNYLAVVRR